MKSILESIILLESKNSSTDELLQWCRKRGIEVKNAPGGHIKIYIQHTHHVMVVGSTESDHRAGLNNRARLRRYMRQLADEGKWDKDDIPEE